MNIINNNDFLTALFGDDTPFVHVTDFNHDPSNIPADKSRFAWSGNWFSRYQMQQETNQYFTISIFNPDEQGIARRRKALFLRTPVIVLDDVKEKLAMSEVKKLPSPSWILETSPGSEQWGYILDEPCADRAMVENLLDGLVANGLAPEGKDPGMKGVTRYVRLPDGHNTKQSKMIDGVAHKCNLTHWQPEQRVTIEQLAKPFMVDLHKQRREGRIDGAVDIEDHPLLKVLDIQERRSEGRYDITCPWLDEHTNEDNSGAAIFTNADHTIGFKCHHGSCQNRTSRDLLNKIDEAQPGFKETFNNYKMAKVFESVTVAEHEFINTVNEPNFLGEQVIEPGFNTESDHDDTKTELKTVIDVLSMIRSSIPGSSESMTLAGEYLKTIDTLDVMQKKHKHAELCDIMRWSKPDFKEILNDLRGQWYDKSTTELDFFNDVVYISELNQFFNRGKGIFYSTEAYQNTYAHLDGEARKEALQGGRVVKADRVDYAPKMPAVFEERGVTYANSWSPGNEVLGVEGDVTNWLNHFDVLGWGDYRKHVLQWMAFTIRHPDEKINHMIIMGSGEGAGKDWLLTPLTRAMSENASCIDGEDLLSSFNDYLFNTKYLHINEAELSDRREAKAVSAKLKPLSTAPPETLRVNPKGTKQINIRNIVNCTMTTNSQVPFEINGVSRRIFAMWSDFTNRDEHDEVVPQWQDYWIKMWTWMNNGGSEAVIHYLRNVVDLSDFNPGVAPPMTEFLRDMREASKSPMEQTIEAFIKNRAGTFQSDLLTSHEISECLRVGTLVGGEHLMFADTKLFTPIRCTNVLKQMSGCVQKRIHVSGGINYKIWILRDKNKYINMSASDLHREYERQRKIKPTMSIVQ